MEEILFLRHENRLLTTENAQLKKETLEQSSLIAGLVDASDYMKLQLIISGALTVPEKKSA